MLKLMLINSSEIEMFVAESRYAEKKLTQTQNA